jgi:Flp pilus assembly protein TadG
MILSGQKSRGVRRARWRRAAAVAELAVLAPLLATIVLGMVEMGRAMIAKGILNDAARKACRTGIGTTGSNSTITTEVTNILGDNNISTTSATVTIQVNGQAVDANTSKQNDQISVKVAVPYSQFAWTSPFFLTNTTIESETVVMMRQQ